MSFDIDFAASNSEEPVAPLQLAAVATPPPSPTLVAQAEPEARHGVVLTLSRNQVRGDQSARFTPLHETGIDRLLRIAAARGASTLYLTSQARPAIRVDGEISAIEGETHAERSRRRGDDARHHSRSATERRCGARPAPNGFATSLTWAASAA